MGEVDLLEIEKRIHQYPPQARQDILLLTRELRRFYSARGGAQPSASLYDALTGLLNGGAYGVRFAMARARATRYRKIFAVMSIDLEFPSGTGPGTGEREQTVKAIAMRLESCVRATDTLARIGEDNFAVILEDLSQPGHAERVKQNVEDALAEPMPVGGAHVVPVTHVHLQFYPRPDGAVH
jgi:diguanylate cyclase (GGDEF)-like protein